MWLRGDGQPVTLENYRGKWVVLNLWATWCAPCVAEMPTLDKLHRRYNKKGLEVIAVNVDNQQSYNAAATRIGISEIESFYRQTRIRYLPVHLDLEDHLTFAYRSKRLPSTYLIDPEGRIVALVDGAEDWFSRPMQSFVDTLLSASNDINQKSQREERNAEINPKNENLTPKSTFFPSAKPAPIKDIFN